MAVFSIALVVSDNDGSAFITKAEFDSLKNNFQAQIDNYNSSIDSKIDGAIASYLVGIAISSTRTIKPEIPLGEKIISTTGNDYGWKEGNMKIDWDMVTGPFGDFSPNYQQIHQTRLKNKQAVSNFREISVDYDETNKSGLYKSHDLIIQNLVGFTIHWANDGYSVTDKESMPYFYFWGWRRINPANDIATPKCYALSCRSEYHGSISGDLTPHNRTIWLCDGKVHPSENHRSLGTVTMRRQKMTSSQLYIVCPNSVDPVWGMYSETRTIGFCNDSKTDALTSYTNTIADHTIMTNDTQMFEFETIHSMARQSGQQSFTVDNTWKIKNGAGWGSNGKITDWTTDATPPKIDGTLTWTQSHNNNYGYYHKPYFGCENIKNWNKIGYDYGSDTNTKIRGANNHGTLVNVNGSQYLSPVSGVPLFISDTKGTAEVTIKFEKDADHMPDTNSTYVDLYISNQPFKENDLGYNNAVIGPKTGTTARKLLSDQPAGHGSGSIKVNYDDITKLKFDVEKDEPIFINFSAYEPNQTNYRGKCTATLQSDISLTVAN